MEEVIQDLSEEVIQGLSRFKIMTVRELKHANDASIAAGYDKNLDFDKFKATFKKYMKLRGEYKWWRGVSKTFVMLEMMGIHEQRSHVRCLMYTNGCFDTLTLDLPIEYYASLTEASNW